MTGLNQAYAGAPIFQRFLVGARPYICPVEPIVRFVPEGVNMLDVGCGVGALLINLALQGKITSGIGMDVNPASIAVAKKAVENVRDVDIRFDVCTTIHEIPNGPFTLVTLIDVMHHVAPHEQEKFFKACIDRTSIGGIFIYKDMAEKPWWKNAFNRFHDIVISRQVIHYVPLNDIKKWSKECGLSLEHESCYSRLAYGHELLVLRKP